MQMEKVNAKHYTYSSIPPFHKVHSSFILLSRCNIHYSAFSQPKNININNHNKQIMNSTQSFLGGNNKAPIPSDVYFLLCIFNFTYCIYVHNLCIDVRCIEINYKE